MATDAELMQLMEQAQNGGVDPNAVAPSGPVNAPVVGTPEGPGIPPIAPVPPSQPSPDATGGFNPDTVTPGTLPTPGAPAVPSPVPLKAAGVDTRAIDQARESSRGAAQAMANKQPLIADAQNAEADASAKTAEQFRNDAIDVQAEAQAQKDGLAEAQRVADKAQDEVKNFKFEDYFKDATIGQKIWANMAYALGAFAAGGKRGSGHNMVAEKMQAAINQQFQQDKANLLTKEKFAEWKKEGVSDMAARYKDEVAKLQIKQSLAEKAVADEAKAFLLRQNVPLKEAENNELVQTFVANGDKTYADGFEKLTHDKAMEALERAKLAKDQPEDPRKLAILAHLAQQPGTTQQDLYDAAAKLGIKDANKSILPIQKNPDKADADAAKKQAALDSRTVMLDGVPSKLASTPRVVKQIEDRDINYGDAISKLKQLRASGDTVPIGSPVYDAAVLAVAATTQANSSDKTTSHEAGTLKKYGLISNDAIDRTIAHLEERRAEFRKNLPDIPSSDSAAVNPSSASQSSRGSMPSADKIRSLPEADRKDAIEATQALGGADDASARKLLRHLKVL